MLAVGRDDGREGLCVGLVCFRKRLCRVTEINTIQVQPILYAVNALYTRPCQKVFGMATVGNVRADAAPSHSLCLTFAESLRWPFRIPSDMTSCCYLFLPFGWALSRSIRQIPLLWMRPR